MQEEKENKDESKNSIYEKKIILKFRRKIYVDLNEAILQRILQGKTQKKHYSYAKIFIVYTKK